MGKNVNKKFTISLDISTDEAEKQVKASAENIKQMLSNAVKDGVGVKELRNIAKSINSIFEGVGQTAPLDIEKNFMGNGSVEKRVKMLTDALDNLAVVIDKIKTDGFNGGTIDGVSKEVQEEIDKLKKQKQEMQEIINVISNPKATNIKVPTKYADQIEQLKALKEAFINAETAKTNLETSNMKGTPEYLDAVGKYIKAAAELKSAFESEKLTAKSEDWVNSNGLNALKDADNALTHFLSKNEATITKAQNMYSEKIKSINNEVEFLTKPYDTLKEKIQEYATLQDTINNDDRLSEDESDKIYDRVDVLEKYFVSLDKAGSKKQEIKKILGDLTFGDINSKDALEELSNLLGVEIPNATNQLDESSAKLQEFLSLVDEIKNTSFNKKWDATDNVEIGKYTERLNVAKAVLDELGNQGQLTADQLEQVNNAFNEAKSYLDVETKTYDGYESGYGSVYDYSDEYQKEKDKNAQLKSEIRDLQNQLNDKKTKVENETQETAASVVDVTASFQELVNYISQSGTSPSTFFDKLEAGAQSVDDELKNILQSLNLIDSAGNINLESLKSGFTNKGGFVSDQYTMIARKITGDWGQPYLKKAEELKVKLAEAQSTGAQIGAIFDIIKDEANGLFYEIQNTVPGKAAFSHHKGQINSDVLGATDSQIKDFVDTIKILTEKGLFIDWGGDNVLYDKDKGFSVIDLGTKGGYSHTVSIQNTVQENVERFVKEMLKQATPTQNAEIKNVFAQRLYDVANSILPSEQQIKSGTIKKSTENTTNAVGAETIAHKNNADAINEENNALKAQIELKKKAQSMKWEEFALDESTSDLKKIAGFQTISDMEKFWKSANYEKQVDFYEISEQEAKKILKRKLPKGLASDWYGGANFAAKDKLENEILADNEIRNAALNFLYAQYKSHMPTEHKKDSVQSFEDFLNTEFTVYRGDKAPLIYGDDSKLSFSFNRSKAKYGFDHNLGTATIKPKDTVGNASFTYGSEIETFIPSSKTSWFNPTGESFADFYSKQTKEMQEEINVGLINLEKRRVADLLGDDLAKITYKAGQTSYFQGNTLKQFQQGIIPDSLEILGDGDFNDQLANAYNGLSDMQKKLVAYYASLNDISSTMPVQFSTVSKSKVGKDANLFNAVLNDPTGVKQHVASLTGELNYNLFGKSEQEIKSETAAIQQHTQAVKEDAKAQQELIKPKADYYQVSDKLFDEAYDADGDQFNEMLKIHHALAQVHKSSSDFIDANSYLDDTTGEVFDISDLISMIDNVESAYGANLDYVKDYLQQVYGNLDFNVQKEVSKPKTSYEDVEQRLVNDIISSNKGDYLELSDIFESLADVKITPDSVIADGYYLSSKTGEVLNVTDLISMINDVEQKYGENLKYVKDYLQQVYGGLDFNKPTIALDNDTEELDIFVDDLIDSSKTDSSNNDFDSIYWKLESLNDGNSEKFEAITKLQSKLSDVAYDMQNNADLISEGKYMDSSTWKATDWAEISDLVTDFESEYGANLEYVHDYLKQVFSKQHTELDQLFSGAVEDNTFYADISDTQDRKDAASKQLQVEQEITAEKKQQLASESEITEEQREQASIVDAAPQTHPNRPNTSGTSIMDSLSLSNSPKTAAGGGAPPNDTSDEIIQLQNLLDAVEIVTQAVDKKTQAFREEGSVVEQVVNQEVTALEKLSGAVDSVTSAVNNKTQAFKNEGVIVEQEGKNDSLEVGQNNASDIQKEVQAHKDNTDAICEEESAQESANNTKKTGFEIVKDYWKGISKQSEQAVEGNAKNLINGILDKTFNVDPSLRKLNFAKIGEGANDIESYTEQYQMFDKVLQLIGYHLGELKPSMIDENNQWGFSAEIVANSEKVVANMEEARKILFGISGTDDGTAGQPKTGTSGKKTSGKTPDQKADKIIYETALKQYKGMLNKEMKSLKDFTSLDENLNAQQQEIADLYNNTIHLIEQCSAAVKKGESVELSSIQNSIDALKEKVKVYKEQNNLTDAGNKKSNQKTYGSNIMTNRTAQHNALQSKISGDLLLQNSSVLKDKMNEYEASWSKLQKLYNTLQNTPNPTEDDKVAFKEASAECNNLGKEVEKLLKIYDKMHNDSNVVAVEDLENYDNRAKELQDYVEATYGAKAAIGDFKNYCNELEFTIDNGNGTFTKAKVAVDNLRTSIIETAGDTQVATSRWGTFINELKNKAKGITTYLISMTGFQEIWQQIRQGVQYVREIDSALTELKKVTDETDATYSKFLKTMSKTASSVGSTVKDLTNSAADWSRLGYSLEDAGQLAATTAKLLNVSEFTSVDEATSALVSALQAFSEDGKTAGRRAEEIVDILNNIGNKYPVATNELAEGLATSGAALVAANNSIEEQVALLSAGNATMQDISTVASGLKIVAARLRGTTTEADDDAESAVTNVSKLQEKIKALTAEANGGKGIDIINESGGYKSTYEILNEISKIFDKMDDISRASLLELIAGKNRSSVVAAILQNGEILDKAYSDALNSAGSSAKELDTYLDSIQGKIDKFNNALQTFWMNTLDSSVIKGVVDAGTKLVQLLDTVHGKILAIVAILATVRKFKDGIGFKKQFDGVVGTIKDIYTAISTTVTATKSLTVATVSQSIASKITNKELAREILINSGLSAATGNLTKEQIKATAATLSKAFADSKLTAAQYLATMSTMGLKTALQGLWTVLKANPIYAIAAAVTAIALALDHFHTTAQEAADAAKEAFDEIQNVVNSTKSTIQSLESELSTLQDKIDELDGKQLSFAEGQELEKLKKQREELEHSLKVQEQLLELQRESSNKQAVASMKAYTKVASEGAEKTQNAWKNVLTTVFAIGGTIGAAVLTGGTSLGVQATAMAAGAAGLGVAGNKIGEWAGSKASENEGTYDSWYETYTKALETARKEEQKALEKYKKDSSNIDKLDKWQEAQQKVSDIETEMYEHLSQMQQYFNGLEYGPDEEINKELDAWYNFLDKFSIDQRASGAEVTALDRIFGENASEEIQTLKEQILDAVSAGRDFDFTAAVNGSQKLKNTLDYVGLSAEDVKNYFTQIGEAASNTAKDVTPVAMYSDLLEDAEAYKEILLQTSEVVVNNTKVTQEYKDSLIELVGSESEVNKYFDENNKLIVKDAKGLNNLVKSAKKNAAANTSLAKSQARLQYYQLFKKMQSYVNAEGRVIAAHKNEVLALYQEMNALEKTIAYYSRLEAQLLDTGNAYDKFEKAQEIDGATDYIGSVEEWIAALGEAFNTAELGTETAQAAIAGLVPENVYKDLDTVDEKMAAIYSYFKNGKLTQYFDIQFDEDGAIQSAEMKLGNLRKFIEDGLANNTFVGSDWMHFDLSESIDSLEEFAKAMGVTEEVAFAFIESMEDHDIEWLNGDYSSMFEDILPDNLANDIYENTSALADLAAQLADGKITAEEYTAKWSELNKVSQENAQKARESASAWIETTNDIEDAKIKVQELSSELEALKQQGASESEIKLKTAELNAAEQDLTNLAAKLSELEAMDPVVLQVALDQAQAEIDAFEQENSTLLAKVEIVQDAESGEHTYEVKAGITLDENEKKKLEGYLEDVNAKYSFENALGGDIATTEDHLQSIENILQSIHDVISGKTSNSAESTGSDDVGGIDVGKLTSIKEFFAAIPEKWDELWNDIGVFLDGLGEEANALKERLGKFFTETVPEKWDEFWNDVSEFFAPLVEEANALKEKVTLFFTNTIPEKWDEFLAKSAEVWNGVQEWADATKEKVVNFFTVTIPEKWGQFWDKAGEVWNNVQEWADATKDTVVNFFSEVIPEKWNQFWGKVDEFLTENLPYAIGYIAGSVARFFVETVPEKWDEFLDTIGEAWEDTKEWTEMTKDKIVNFFTNTIPEKWNEFLDSIDKFIDESIKPALSAIGDAVKKFFRETIPEKWQEFCTEIGKAWDNITEWANSTEEIIVAFFTQTIPDAWSKFWGAVGAFIDENITPALSAIADAIKTFFVDTIPTKWNEFWINVGNFINEHVIPSLQTIKEKISEFFLVTIPQKWSELWNNVGTFLTTTVPQVISDLKTGITTFFTVTVPSAVNSLWNGLTSWISEKASAFWSNLTSGWNAGRSGSSSVNGTAHAAGTAHKSGNWGLPKSERNSLVGELGTELVWKIAR